MDYLKKLKENAGQTPLIPLSKRYTVTRTKFMSPILKLLANFFDTSIDYLLGNTNIPSKPERVEQFDLNEEEADVVTKYRSLKKNERESHRLILNSLLEH